MMMLLLLFLVEVIILVIVVIKPRLSCCLGREVLVLRRCRYRVIAFAGGRERHFRHSKKNITCISKLYQFLTSKNRRKKTQLLNLIPSTGTTTLSHSSIANLAETGTGLPSPSPSLPISLSSTSPSATAPNLTLTPPILFTIP